MADLKQASIDMWREEAWRIDAKLRKAEAALRAIADLDIPRPVAVSYRGDGKPSKHDRCPHGGWMYDECAHCVADFARKALGAHE